jgi:hypothetical protein
MKPSASAQGRAVEMAIVATVLLVFAAVARSSQAGANGIHVAFSARKSQFMLGEPIIIDCQITNSSQTVFEFMVFDAPMVTSGAFSFEAVPGKGTFRTPNTEIHDFDERYPDSIVVYRAPRLLSGDPLTEAILLNWWLTPEELGHHEVQCSLKSVAGTFTQIVSFESVPTDPAKLCAWVRAAVSSVQDKPESVLKGDVLDQAIGFVGSPAAIPELRRAAEQGIYTAVEALKRIGGDEATKTLVELSKNADTNLAARALWFLGKGGGW